MKNKFVLSVIIFIIVFSTITVSADDTVTNVDGKTIGFQLEESLPQNNSVDVALDIEIKLLFNKNVVNMSIKENNAKCIKLLNSNGEIVSSELFFPDDQIEPERKREIIIKPSKPLNENETYKVEISSDMQAKNGTILGVPAFVSFTTVKPLIQENSQVEVSQDVDKTVKDSENVVNAVTNNDTSTKNENQNNNENNNENNSGEIPTDNSNEDSLNPSEIDSKDEVKEVKDEEKEVEELENKSSITQDVEPEEENEKEKTDSNNVMTNKRYAIAAILILMAIIGAFVFKRMKKR